jgi:DNA-binding response OmpR family regulator
MKVLIIEDNKFVRTVYEAELHQENIEVELAEDGEVGLAKALNTKPDLILMDLILPRKNGFVLLEELKADAKTKKIPVVVTSALGQKSDIDEVMKMGAIKYFTKDNYSQKQIIQEVLKLLMNV